MSTLAYSTTLTVLACGECGIPFAIPQDMHKSVRNDGRSFWCPNGHKISYAETENRRLARQLADAKWQRDWAESARKAAEDQARAAEYARRAQKAQNTRLRKRIAAGVCPCCNRTFQNLGRHMDSRHPGFGDSDDNTE